MSVIGTAQNSAGAAIDLIYHHKLNEHVEVASRSHDTPHFMTELMMPYLLCGRVCWINSDTAHQREVRLAAAVPGRCQSASWMVVFRWSKSRQSGATRELASNTNQIAKPIWNRGRAATLRRQNLGALPFINVAPTSAEQIARELNQCHERLRSGLVPQTQQNKGLVSIASSVGC